MAEKLGSNRLVVHSPPAHVPDMVADPEYVTDLSPGTEIANALTSSLYFLDRGYVPEALKKLDEICGDSETTLETEVVKILGKDQKEIFTTLHATAQGPCAATLTVMREYKARLLGAIKAHRREILDSDQLDDVRAEFQAMIEALPEEKTNDGVLQERVNEFIEGFVEDSSVVNLEAFKIKCRARLPLVQGLYERDPPEGFDEISDLAEIHVVREIFTPRIGRVWRALTSSVNAMAQMWIYDTTERRFDSLTIAERLDISLQIEQKINGLFFADDLQMDPALPYFKYLGKRYKLIRMMEKKFEARLLAHQREYSLFK